MFKNKEVKNALVKLVMVQMALVVLLVLALNYQYNSINENIIKEEALIVGNIVKYDYNLEKEIIPVISGKDNRENLELGRGILNKYGYDSQISMTDQHVFGHTHRNFLFIGILAILSTTIIIGYIIISEYGKLYMGIKDVSAASERVVEGDYSIKLSEIGEGDLDILNHQFNQMSYVLENTVNNLEKEKDFLENMISDISHQLKTPLSSLIMLNDLMLNDKDMEVDIRNEFLRRSKLQLDRMEWLIINLLKVARIEAGSIDFKKEKVNIKEMVDSTISYLSDLLEGLDVQLVGSDEDFFIGDKQWTEEALINIIKNASEHTNNSIKIDWDNSTIFSTITIEDDGDGIDKEDLPHIFKRFYRTNRGPKVDSIGIGLNLSKLIVESQGGLISVESKKGLGSKFRIRFLN